MQKLHALLAIVSVLGFLAAPRVAPAQAWDVTTPRGETREIDFTTSEGTWMSVDIAPDGSWLVFDLLGHVYRVDVAGGAINPTGS